jgi:hypothetical protein
LVADERARRAHEIGEGHDRVRRRRRLREASPGVETVEAVEHPTEDPRQLAEQLVGEGRVLTAQPALAQGEHHEAIRDRPRRVAESGELVADDEEARGQCSGPRLLVLDVHGERVLARDGQKALDDLVHVGPAQPGVWNDRQRLPNERWEAEVRSERRQGRTGVVAPSDEGLEDPGDHALAGSGRTNEQQDLVQVASARDDVAHELGQGRNRIRIVMPELIEEREPTCRSRRVGLVIKRHGDPIEIGVVVRE